MSRPGVDKTFLPSQQEFIMATDDEVMNSGSYGSGKSTALCEKALYLSARYPKNRGVILRKELYACKATTLKTLIAGDGSRGAVIEPAMIKTHRYSDREIELVNGSVILYGGMGRTEDLSWLRSLNVGWVAVDQAEEITFDDWMVCIGRVRLDIAGVRQVFGACNPAYPGHWIYQRFYLERPEGTRLVESNTLENDYLPADYQARLSRYKGIHYDRYVLGKWVAFEGLVWPNYSPAVHLIDSFEVPADWERFISVDFGYRNPFVAQWWVVVPETFTVPGGPVLLEGTLVLYREWYKSQWTVSRHCEKIHELTGDEDIVYIVADHDHEDRATMAEEGLVTTPAEKAVSTGLQEVSDRLGNIWVGENGRPAEPGKGTYIPPSLYIFRDALVEEDVSLKWGIDGRPTGHPMCTADEIPGYVWKKRAGKFMDEPVKDRDHGCDGKRYAVMSRLWRGRSGVH